jgi:GGDEF domain-containing protein
MGAAFYPQDGLDAEQLLAEADKRMYAAKRLHYEGRGRMVQGLVPRPFLVSAS